MTWAWVQNADRERVDAWADDLPGHVFGIKHIMRVKWNTERVVVGFPKATRRYTAEELFDRGVVGLYAERIDGR